MKEKIKNWWKNNWFKLVAILFLLGALGSWSYSYYQFLKWIILGAGIYSAYLAYQSKQIVWTWIFGIIALLFNPIIPFYFSRETWQFLDVVAAIIFFVSLFFRFKGSSNIEGSIN